jgi:integrase
VVIDAHQHGTLRSVFSTTWVLATPRRVCAAVAATHPELAGIRFTPHDFRRIFATELVNNGLQIHIGAALLGHTSLQTTRGYVAVFDDDVVRHYQHFLDHRRQLRPAAAGPAPNRKAGSAKSTGSISP